jgi:hypothetical protein
MFRKIAIICVALMGFSLVACSAGGNGYYEDSDIEIDYQQDEFQYEPDYYDDYEPDYYDEYEPDYYDDYEPDYYDEYEPDYYDDYEPDYYYY